MQVSGEIRWFWPAAAPPGFETWFRAQDDSARAHPHAAGGGRPREDAYLRDAAQSELGIKTRGGQETDKEKTEKKREVEVKGLVTVFADGVASGPFAGPIEVWTKWTSTTLALDRATLIRTTKVRYLRKFDTAGPEPSEIALGEDEKPVDPKVPLPARGCNVELTRVAVDEEIWWTLGFEAFGRLETIAGDLRAVARELARRNPPALGDAIRASYPLWLAGRLEAGRK